MTREEMAVFDRENRELNYLRPGLYQDMTEKPEYEPEMPEDYRADKVTMAAKITLLVALLGSLINFLVFACMVGR